MISKEQVLKALESVIDPHIGLSVVDLGFIYDIIITPEKVTVKMTLTTPACPLSRYLVAKVREAVESLGVKAEVALVFEPPWTPERMSEKAKRMLGYE